LFENIAERQLPKKVIGSVQHLEYSIAEGLNKITKAKQKKIAVKETVNCKIF
jgi:hypothetical protein